MTDRELMQMALDALDWKLTTLLKKSWENHHIHEVIKALRNRLAQPEPKPVAWAKFNHGEITHSEMTDGSGCDFDLKAAGFVPLYTAPTKRSWVGLTDEEIKAFDTWHDNREEEVGWCNPSEIVAYIEAKLKEKNT
jgi:hypothetical protein